MLAIMNTFVVPDADNRNYGSDYDRNLLYIACTRAMHKLILFYTGCPSPFLPNFLQVNDHLLDEGDHDV